MAIVGGIVELTTAYGPGERFPDVSITVLEKKSGVGRHQRLTPRAEHHIVIRVVALAVILGCTADAFLSRVREWQVREVRRSSFDGKTSWIVIDRTAYIISGRPRFPIRYLRRLSTGAAPSWSGADSTRDRAS